MAKVTLHKDDDPEIVAAGKTARGKFRYFWRELSWEYRRIVPGLDVAAFKVPFSDGDEDDVPCPVDNDSSEEGGAEANEVQDVQDLPLDPSVSNNSSKHNGSRNGVTGTSLKPKATSITKKRSGWKVSVQKKSRDDWMLLMKTGSLGRKKFSRQHFEDSVIRYLVSFLFRQDNV